MLKGNENWAEKAKRLIFNLFMIALLVIAIIKVLIEELHSLHK